MKILKFGGSSIGTPDKINNVVEIVKNSKKESGTIAVVFSAFHGITDKLIKLSKLAADGDQSYLELSKEIEDIHLNTIKKIISVKNQSGVLTHVKLTLNELDDVIHGVFLVKELSLRTLDFIMSFGERISAYTISKVFEDRDIDAEYLDSRDLIVTDMTYGSARVLFEQTNEKIKKYFDVHKKLQIVTGFIASSLEGQTTTLGRGGSDYSASIFAAALKAKEIEIWTDVDGVLTADPKKVKKAFSIKSLTYEEAMELSHFGAKVIHPPTMQPALNKKIPIRIKNTFNPAFEGTIISEKGDSKNFSIKGISSIDDIALLRIQGSGMIGVAGIARRIFGALAAKKVSVILISQASSEHSICFAVMPQFAEDARKAIEDELRFEIKDKLVSEILIEKELSIIAVVGENMRNTPGISGKVFQALGRNGINVVAIAQGSSELNISAVVPKVDEEKALNALHDAFFLTTSKTVNIFLVGTGLIGSTLLKQITHQKNYLSEEYNLFFRVIALANSKKMYFDTAGVNTDEWKNLLHEKGTRTNLNKFIDSMKNLNLPNSIFVDCTASEEVTIYYTDVLKSAISVVTPNKRANSKDYSFYQEIKNAARKHNVQFLYETNVGAGLPIIGTLKDLVSSGDRVDKIEGVLSGTLSYIFNSFTMNKKFSEIIKEAKEKGYTEPDPREDLNGLDVARKLLILAREIGLSLELKNIKVQNLIPVPARNTKSIDDFFKILKNYDCEFEELRKKAEQNGNVLRYVARLENGTANIGLEEVPKSHPFYFLTESDNIFAFTTKHYKDRPIVVKGPGAGPDVTAAGVFADIIRIAHYLG
ncbi:MAG TPA: bifunctional aspartate kinase/homoserine dehydrogenase I [Ignavibacteriaceae bacterium]|nr:bifunctional aspartate kinase/homoserine dehydrogenase I [Ignavibacteriaceae bacterium]